MNFLKIPMPPTILDVVPLLGHFGPSADGATYITRSLDCSSVPDFAISEIYSQFSFVERLSVAGRRLSSADVTDLFSLPHLTELNLSNCGLNDAQVEWHMLPVCPLLLTLTLSCNDLEELPSLRFCPNLVNLDLSRNKLFEFPSEVSGDALPYLERLDISRNVISSLKGNNCCPNVFWLDAAHNILTSDAHIDRFPSLRYCNLSHNRITSIEHLAPLQNPNLRTLLLHANCINQLSCIKKLIPFKLLRELVVTSDDTLSPSQKEFTNGRRFKRPDNDGLHVAVTLKDARILALGDLMARQDEVSFAVGVNRTVDPYADAPSANKSLFEQYRKNAVATLPTPANTIRALLIYILPQLLYLNWAEVTIDERLEAETWILPSEKVLALSHVIGL